MKACSFLIKSKSKNQKDFEEYSFLEMNKCITVIKL